MDPQIQNSLEQADALQANGEVADAARIYRAVLDREPKQPDANYALGVITASAGNNEAALSLFETAIEVNPAEQQFWFSFIDCLVNKRDFCRAEEALDFVGRAGASTERINELRQQLRLAEQTAVRPEKTANSLATKRAAAAQKKRAKATEEGLGQRPQSGATGRLNASIPGWSIERGRRIIPRYDARFPRSPVWMESFGRGVATEQ